MDLITKIMKIANPEPVIVRKERKVEVTVPSRMEIEVKRRAEEIRRLNALRRELRHDK